MSVYMPVNANIGGGWKNVSDYLRAQVILNCEPPNMVSLQEQYLRLTAELFL